MFIATTSNLTRGFLSLIFIFFSCFFIGNSSIRWIDGTVFVRFAVRFTAGATLHNFFLSSPNSKAESESACRGLYNTQPDTFWLIPFQVKNWALRNGCCCNWTFLQGPGRRRRTWEKKVGGHFTLFDVILLAVRIEEWKNENSKVEKNEIFSNFYDPKRLFVAELMCVRAFPSRSPFHPQDFNVHIFVRRNNKIKIYPQWKTQHTKIFTSSFRLISDTHIRNSHFFSI